MKGVRLLVGDAQSCLSHVFSQLAIDRKDCTGAMTGSLFSGNQKTLRESLEVIETN